MAVSRLVFGPWLGKPTFTHGTRFYHLKTRQVRYSDPHCTLKQHKIVERNISHLKICHVTVTSVLSCRSINKSHLKICHVTVTSVLSCRSINKHQVTRVGIWIPNNFGRHFVFYHSKVGPKMFYFQMFSGIQMFGTQIPTVFRQSRHD